MTTVFKDDFMDGLLAQGRAEGEVKGRAEGEARGEVSMLLRILAARGIAVPDDVRDRVTSCTDTGQIEAWFDRAITASTLTEVFGS
jgi:hypothetical protein